MKSRSSFETKVLVAFSAAVLVVSGLAATTWKLARDESDAARRVAHTHEVLDSLARIRSDTLQIEINTQNYRISGDRARLVERDAAIARRETLLTRLKQLTGDNARQQQRWAGLREVLNQRIAISRQVEHLRTTQGLAASSAYVASAPLQETRERTYRLLREMDAEEQQLLEQRNAGQSQAHELLLASGTLVAALLVALLSATYVLIRRQLRETEASARALAANEQGLATTLHSIGDAVLATDTAGRITRMNTVAEALTGWPLAEARGQPIETVFRIVNEHTREPAEVPVARALATGVIQELANHTMLVARDGGERPISDSAAPIRDGSGQVSGAVLVFRDVTLAHQAQKTIREQNELLEQRVRERTAQLHASEDHLRSLINNVPAIIAFVDHEQRYVYVNNQYRARFAPGHADITGQTVREILGEERYARVSPMIEQALQGLKQSYDWEPFPGVWQLINYLPKRDARQQPIGYYVLGTDITERKLAEEKIQTLNAELKQHVHELEHVSRALRTLSAGNRTMLHARDEQGLLDGMCGAIVEAGGYQMASVWYRCDDEARTLQPMAQTGHADGLAALRRLNASWADNERGRGIVATAIRSGQTSVVDNMLTDPNYERWRPELTPYASGVACPLRSAGEVIGALAIYAKQPGAFGPDETALLGESADDLAFGIATLRARAEQEKVEAAMLRLTRFDALTGLPNETQFTELLNSAVDHAQQQRQSFAVLQTNIERLRAMVNK